MFPGERAPPSQDPEIKSWKETLPDKKQTHRLNIITPGSIMSMESIYWQGDLNSQKGNIIRLLPPEVNANRNAQVHAILYGVISN